MANVICATVVNFSLRVGLEF